MELRISDIIDNFLRSYVLVLVVIILTLSIGLYGIYGVYENEYVSKTTLMLGYSKDESKFYDIYLNQSILKNYTELAVSNIALSKIKEDTKLDYSLSELKKIISINCVDGTEYIVIEATTNNKYDSAKISYSVYEILSSEVERIFGFNNIHLVDTSSVGVLKYNKNIFVVVVIMIAIVLSFLASIIKLFLFPNLLYKNSLEKNKKSEKSNEKLDTLKAKKTNVKKVDTKVEKVDTKKTTVKKVSAKKKTVKKKL